MTSQFTKNIRYAQVDANYFYSFLIKAYLRKFLLQTINVGRNNEKELIFEVCLF